MKKLFLLDAFALIYRAYFSFANNHRYNSKKQNTSAQFGFTNTLIEILNKEKPTHIAVVFDAPGATDREVIYEAYKANREEMPDDIRLAIPQIMQIIEAMNIPILLKEGYEADDVVGAIAKKAEPAGFTTYMMTPDKDYGQLVTEKTFIYKPGRMGNPPEVMGIPEVCAKFEIQQISQVIDLLALWGDAVDNIPGIPGVGEKTAKKLLAEYGTLENILASADKIPGKLGEKIKEGKELALISKQLATIITEVPIDIDFEAMAIQKPNADKLIEILSDLEFRTLAKRILGEDLQVSSPTGQVDLFGNPVNMPVAKTKKEALSAQEEEKDPVYTSLKTAQDMDHEYLIVNTPETWAKLLQALQQAPEFCFDTETTSLDETLADLVGISISVQASQAFYIPCIGISQQEMQSILERLQPFLSTADKLKIAQNIKYDLAILQKYGLKIAPPLFDTMIAHYLLMPDMRHGMDLLAETYLQYKPISIETLIGKKGKNQKSMAEVDLVQIAEYAAEDADITYQLKQIFAPMLAQSKAQEIFQNIEMPLTQILADMEAEGISIDVKALQNYSSDLEQKLQVISEKIFALAGVQFNIDSPKQMGEVLYEHLKIVDKPKKTKTGQYATGEEVLVLLKNKHEIIPQILQFRMYRKLKNTYVDPLPLMASPQTGRIHTSFMQTVAATGRLSSNNPNLQNIPIKTEDGREIRKAFIARSSDYILLSADYSQIELRIMAALSGDENMQEAFRQKKDIHTATAAKIFHVSESEVTREMRGKAKAVNFGIIYGQSAFGLAENLQISRTEAKNIIDSYFAQYPQVKAYMDQSKVKAKETGYVETLLGRRRYLKDINSGNAVVRGHAERNAINAPIQGTAADIIKLAMIQIHQSMKSQKVQSKMLLQVHDELVFDVHVSEIEIMKNLVKVVMESAFVMSVPLEVEVGVGNNWLEAH